MPGASARIRHVERCQVLLRVSAMLNETPFPNSLLQDVSITLSTKDTDSNIGSTLSTKDMDGNIESEVSVKPVLKDDVEGLVVPLRISKPIQSVKASMTASIVTNNGVKKQLSASLNLYTTEYNPKRNLNIEEIEQSLLTLCSEREPRREWSSLCMRPVLQANRIPVARNRREGRGFAGISPESM